MKRKPYPSDLTDEQWMILADLIPEAKPGGCPRKHDMREVLNGILYLLWTGCQVGGFAEGVSDFRPESTICRLRRRILPGAPMPR